MRRSSQHRLGCPPTGVQRSIPLAKLARLRERPQGEGLGKTGPLSSIEAVVQIKCEAPEILQLGQSVGQVIWISLFLRITRPALVDNNLGTETFGLGTACRFSRCRKGGKHYRRAVS